jgi:hypothetical protein
MPLIGAARYVPLETHAALVFDFGHSFVKRAIAIYKEGQFTQLKLLPTLSTSEHFAIYHQTPELPWVVTEYMTDIITQTFNDSKGDYSLSPFVVCSIATHLNKQGTPVSEGGYYGILRNLSDNLPQFLTEQTTLKLKRPCKIYTMNDGIAAASVHTAKPNSAAVMVGTAIGSGFAPTYANLYPLGSQVEISEVV